MSIPPDSEWRGCAAYFRQPLAEEDEYGAQMMVEHIYYFNCRTGNPPLPDIEYRSSRREQDITRPVYRWDRTDYRQVFQEGFQARRQDGTPDHVFYYLQGYVNHGGRPLDLSRPVTYAFVSTTLDIDWTPRPALREGEELQVYRYEIYAPGGIWVAATLGERYRYPHQDEVCFVAGIAPQYIRSAQLFVARGYGSRLRLVTDEIYINTRFNPQSHPQRNLTIERPILDHFHESGAQWPLTRRPYPPLDDGDNSGRARREVSDDAQEWYAEKVGDETNNFINSAFRAKARNEAYIFVRNKYVLINYAPGSTNDYVINGPHRICDGYPSFTGTTFGENGIDCAFDTDDGTTAFIFTGNLCAYIDYAPGTTNDKILKGPMPIKTMFPFFKNTVFENGIDSAFKSTAKNEAYLFRGDQYARINYSSNDARAIAFCRISEGFYSLKGTIFESGIDAAFASHRKDEAYIFKGDQYARINFAPGSTKDYIIGGVYPVLPTWPSLSGILNGNNRGIDSHDHHEQDEPGHDEL